LTSYLDNYFRLLYNRGTVIEFLNNVLDDIDWHKHGLYADEGNFDNSRGLDIAQRSLIIGLMILTLSAE
jgi:hypothetical protein